MGALSAYLQFLFPLSYPWPLVIFFLIYVGAAVLFLVENKKDVMQTVLQILPSCFFLLALGITFLLTEALFARWLVTLLLFLIPLLMLELLYLALFESFRYPVNAISRINIAFIPAVAFLLGVSGSGLNVFLRISPFYSLIIFPVVIGLLYDITAHPTADGRHRIRWGVLGTVIGLQTAILILLLPVPLVAHGVIAAILVSVPIRVRRYAYQPTPSKKHAWFESGAVLIFFLTILLISPWA